MYKVGTRLKVKYQLMGKNFSSIVVVRKPNKKDKLNKTDIPVFITNVLTGATNACYVTMDEVEKEIKSRNLPDWF